MPHTVWWGDVCGGYVCGSSWREGGRKEVGDEKGCVLGEETQEGRGGERRMRSGRVLWCVLKHQLGERQCRQAILPSVIGLQGKRSFQTGAKSSSL